MLIFWNFHKIYVHVVTSSANNEKKDIAFSEKWNKALYYQVEIAQQYFSVLWLLLCTGMSNDLVAFSDYLIPRIM